jgi:hypothetical protein
MQSLEWWWLFARGIVWYAEMEPGIFNWAKSTWLRFLISAWIDHIVFRYCNVDFIVLAALVGVMLLRIVITYDIACQWSKNFRKRMEEFPPQMQIPETTKVGVAIPGWHINGHGESCRENFNLSYMEGAARTVGEDVETIWSGTNPLAPSIREMGPAARHDTLNDHWNGWNFRKVVRFRTFCSIVFCSLHPYQYF